MTSTKTNKQELIAQYAINPNDTGSVEVQVALLTGSIQTLTQHCKENPNDFSSRRGLLMKVAQRKTFLKYLEKRDKKSYTSIAQRLGLKK